MTDLKLAKGGLAVPTLSVTQLNMFQRCPRQYAYRYLFGIKIPPTTYLAVGTGVHGAIEVGLLEKQRTGVHAKESVVMDAARDAAKEAMITCEPEEEYPPEMVVDTSVAMAKLWHREVYPHRNPLNPQQTAALSAEWSHPTVVRAGDDEDAIGELAARPVTGIEQGFEVNLDGVQRPIIGYIDFIEDSSDPFDLKRVSVIDHKTAKRAYAAGCTERNHQLTMYAAVANGAGLNTIEVGFDVLVKPLKTAPSGKAQQMRSEGAFLINFNAGFAALLGGFQEVEAGIKSGLMPPHYGQHCSWCGYKDKCDAETRCTYMEV